MIVTLGLAVRAFAGGVLGADPAGRLELVPIRIDLNRAGLFELQALPGVGPAGAEAIILHRLRHGPFRSRAALDAVDGFGVKTVAALQGLTEPP